MADSKKLVLPLEYQEVEYIENTGTTQYIDTGWKRDFSKDIEIETDVKITTLGKRYCIISDYAGQYSYNFSLEINNSDLVRLFVRSGTNEMVNPNPVSNVSFRSIKYTFNAATLEGVVFVDGVSSSITFTSDVADRKASVTDKIFIDNDMRYSTFNNAFQLKKMAIKENGTLVRNFIPVKRISDNELGLYDTVNDVFYTNQGTGSFTVGANVSSWKHSLRKLTTATEAVENPLYSDGTAITSYTLKGNEEHTGTPSPSNPVMPNGVGERTENYFNVQNYVANITTHSCTVSAAANGVKITATGSDAYAGETYKSPDRANSGDSQAAIPVEENTSYVLSADVDTFDGCYISYLDSSYDALNTSYTKIGADVPATFTTPTGTAYIALRLGSKSLGAGQSKTFANITLTKNGLYKIPISNGQQTTNIDLGSTQTLRQIKKLVLTGDEYFALQSINDHGIANFQRTIPAEDKAKGGSTPCYCTHFPQSFSPIAQVSEPNILWANTPSRDFFIRIEVTTASNLTELQTWLTTQYNNGTPVTIYYVLDEAETAAVNEPLMKIGDYADTLSNAVSIPTTEGANSITVDTTVQPSEFTATWTGWHNATVKEKSENLFDSPLEQGTLAEGSAVGSTYTQTKGAAVTTRVRASNLIYVGGTATISVDFSKYYLYLLCFDANQQYTGEYTATWQTEPVVVNTQYVGILIRNKNNTTLSPDTTDFNLMLNTGSTALPYEPYWK